MQVSGNRVSLKACETTAMPETANWAGQIRKELVGNILPFWMLHAIDRENGGFYGTIGCDLKVEKESLRASVINSRILWTFSAASRLIGGEYRNTADWAYDTVVNAFWDREYGGLFWTLDYRGNPVSMRQALPSKA